MRLRYNHGALIMVSRGGLKGQISSINATADATIVRGLDNHFKPGQVFSAQVLRSVSSKKNLDLILHGTATGPAPIGKTLARLEKIEDLAIPTPWASDCKCDMVPFREATSNLPAKMDKPCFP